MTSELFEEWVQKLDRMFCDKARNIALLEDNCPNHRDISNLTNLKLLFLPPNRYSVLQPTDKEVIRSLKAQYCRLVVRMCIEALDKNQPLPKISILQAITTLASSWSAMPPHVIFKCFSEARISDSSQQAASTDEIIHSKN